MKISIISIGKFENSPHKLVFEEYVKRLQYKIELKELDVKNAHNLSAKEVVKEQGELIINTIKNGSKIIVLDEQGKQFSSVELARKISDFAVGGDSHLSFIIGGSDGLSKEVLDKADLKISFGKMTLPHLMVRSVLVEQLYRAWAINNKHPYHREGKV